MTWRDGHFWEATLRLPYNPDSDIERDRGVFLYKYGLKTSEGMIKLEKGLDRIADLRLLNGQKVMLNDVWEKFTINFMVYEPKLPEDEAMCIAGDISELGNWIPQVMNLEE